MSGAMSKWWSKETVAVVTGSNKGIGYEIVKLLLKNGVTTVLTARDQGRGQKAVDTLKAEGLHTPAFHVLDVGSDESVDNLVVWLKKEYGGIDILVNNAGIAFMDMTYETTKATLDTNYYGVKRVTSKLVPVIKPGGRIVTIGSTLGQLSFLKGESLKQQLGDENNLSEEMADSFATKFLEAVKAGTWKEDGWGDSQFVSYSVSKCVLNAYIRSVAKTLASEPGGQKVFMNVVCPGFVATDLNGNASPHPASDGADTPVWVALLPAEEYPNGKFFKDKKEMSY